jgi:hypothetical protein
MILINQAIYGVESCDWVSSTLFCTVHTVTREEAQAARILMSCSELKDTRFHEKVLKYR